MSALIDIGTLITQTPRIHSDRPHRAGTGVTVRRIAMWYKLGSTPEAIVQEIDHLSLAQVYGALPIITSTEKRLMLTLLLKRLTPNASNASTIFPDRAYENLSPRKKKLVASGPVLVS